MWQYNELYHHGIKGQKWGVRRFQNEDGSLTDGQGTKVKFNNSIIILTSNLGAEDMYRESEMGFAVKTKRDEKALKAEHDANEEAAMKALRKLMRPELVNRFDAIVTFNALSHKDVEKILIT